MKKKYLYISFGFILVSLLLIGCGQSHSDTSSDWELTPHDTVNQLENMNMTIKKGTVSKTGLTVVFQNHSDKDYLYGEFFSLEKKIDGEWYEVPVIFEGEYGFNTIGYDLAANSEQEWSIEWDWLYGPLDVGEYRIIKDILEVKEPGDYQEYILAAEFSIES